MKKLGLLALPLLLAACGTTGSSPENRPYTITIEPMGYRVTTEETGYKITITNADIALHSVAGAPDVRSVDYTAVLLNSNGERAALDNSVITPATGTMFGKARGGYICTKTAPTLCSMSSPDAIMVNTGKMEWPENNMRKFIMPFEWADAHYNAYTSPGVAGEDAAGWYTEFTFTAVQSNGKTVVWKQNYQIIAPAGD